MLQIENLRVSYGKKEILHGADLTVLKGSITCLLGPNGCGKTTLMRAAAGIEKFSGSIKIEGRDIKELPGKIRAQHTAYLSQGKNVPDIKVSSLVLHGRFPYLSYPRKYKKEDILIAEEAMKKAGVYSFRDENTAMLSGGMRQKVYIAMALCQQTDIILLDEPQTYLDISEQLKLYSMIKDLAFDGKTILFVSHDIVPALKISDYAAVMDKGVIRAYGTPADIIKSGIIPSVFGVDIIKGEIAGETEYFLRKQEKGI